MCWFVYFEVQAHWLDVSRVCAHHCDDNCVHGVCGVLVCTLQTQFSHSVHNVLIVLILHIVLIVVIVFIVFIVVIVVIVVIAPSVRCFPLTLHQVKCYQCRLY